MAFLKDPAEVLDYLFDFAPKTNGNGSSDYLEPGETIVSHQVAIDTGMNIDSHPATTTAITVWLSSGTLGTNYNLTCTVTTNAGRTVKRSTTIECRSR